VPYLQAMLKNVFSVTVAVLETPKELNDLWMESAYTSISYSPFATLPYVFPNFFLCSGHHLFNASGMYSSVGN
jgi:hypothetical protein